MPEQIKRTVTFELSERSYEIIQSRRQHFIKLIESEILRLEIKKESSFLYWLKNLFSGLDLPAPSPQSFAPPKHFGPLCVRVKNKIIYLEGIFIWDSPCDPVVTALIDENNHHEELGMKYVVVDTENLNSGEDAIHWISKTLEFATQEKSPPLFYRRTSMAFLAMLERSWMGHRQFDKIWSVMVAPDEDSHAPLGKSIEINTTEFIAALNNGTFELFKEKVGQNAYSLELDYIALFFDFLKTFAPENQIGKTFLRNLVNP